MTDTWQDVDQWIALNDPSTIIYLTARNLDGRGVCWALNRDWHVMRRLLLLRTRIDSIVNE